MCNDTNRKIELRHVDRNTIILWVSVGQNIFVYKDGLNRDVYEEIVSFEQGNSRFSSIQELYTWALEKR